MITARAILLEVKRRLGDTNTPYPDEVDALAFLNRALLGMYNYGVYMNSTLLRKIETYDTDAVGVAEISGGIAKIYAVASKTDGKILSASYGLTQAMRSSEAQDAPSWYKVEDNKVVLCPPSKSVKNLVLDYIPAFTKITNRATELQLNDSLFNVAVDWVVALIQGKQATVSDMEFANSNGYANTLSQYYRGKTGSQMITGQGPW